MEIIFEREVYWTEEGKNVQYTAKKRFGRQTAYITFHEDYSAKKVYWYVEFQVYTKRKHIEKNFERNTITGENGVQPLLFAKDSILAFYDFLKKEFPDQENIIVVQWADNLRKKIYTHFLPRYGFQKDKFFGKEALLLRVV